MPSYSGTIGPGTGYQTLDASLNDSVTFTPTSAVYTVEYPIGTVAINGASTTQTLALTAGGQFRVAVKSGSVAYAVIDFVDSTALTPAQTAAVAKITYRRAGNLTTGVGADLVFSGAGGAGAGKLNTGVDLLIPANTIVAGQSIIKLVLHARRTGTDASFLDVRFGPNNGTSDGVMMSAAQFSAGANPGDIQIILVAAATAAGLTSAGQISIVNVAATGVAITELASLNFAVDNYVTVVASGCTTGSYRVVSVELQVFQ